MGTKYDSNSISGYNSTPPPDDGSVSEANKVKWSTIKNKLTDPTKALAEAINTDINTALDYGPISVVSAAVTLGASHNNQFIEMSGASTPTLNSADGLGAGWFCDVKNIGSTAITVARTKSGDTINDVTADVTMNPLDYIRFVVNAAASGFVTVQVKKATAAQVAAGTASDVFVTPETLSPPTVSGYTGGRIVYVEGDNGRHAIAFDIDSVIAGSFESIGPTGSGADNIWTATDVIPSTAKLIVINVYNLVSGSTNGDTYQSNIYARKTGSTTAIGSTQVISASRLINRSGSQEVDVSLSSSIFIPIDSNLRFDLYLDTLGTSVAVNATAYLVGWIE